MACDICGENTRPLTEISTLYQTDEIKQICGSCETAINKHLSKVRDMTHNILVDLMKRAMQGMRKRKGGRSDDR